MLHNYSQCQARPNTMNIAYPAALENFSRHYLLCHYSLGLIWIKPCSSSGDINIQWVTLAWGHKPRPTSPFELIGSQCNVVNFCRIGRVAPLRTSCLQLRLGECYNDITSRGPCDWFGCIGPLIHKLFVCISLSRRKSEQNLLPFYIVLPFSPKHWNRSTSHHVVNGVHATQTSRLLSASVWTWDEQRVIIRHTESITIVSVGVALVVELPRTESEQTRWKHF